MSIVEHAKYEMQKAGHGEDDVAAMITILRTFFGQWDSGGAVWAMTPVLTRLLAGKPLSPLTGEPDEWIEVGESVFQNRRASTVFKDPRFHEGNRAYDLDNPAGPREAIEFPYWPERAVVSSPVIEI